MFGIFIKKNIVLISFLILCLIAFSFILDSGFLYIDHNKKNDLFNSCKPKISIREIPRNASEYNVYSKNIIKSKNDRYDLKTLNRHNLYVHSWEKFKQLAESLGENYNDNDSSFMGFSKNDKSELYYDKDGNLLIIEQTYWLTWGQGICRYDAKGNLLEASYIDNEQEFTFNNKKKLMYYCYRGHCNYPLIKYKNFKEI